MTSDQPAATAPKAVAEALRRSGGGYEIIVNLQGDAPLTPAWFVEDLVAGLRRSPTAEIATPVLRCDGRGAGRSAGGPPRRPGRRHHGGVRPGRPARPLLLEGSRPLHRRAPMRPKRRRRCSTMSASMPTAPPRWRPIRCGRPARWRAEERLEQLRFLEQGHSDAVRRGRSPWPCILGAEQSRGRAEGGSDAGARWALPDSGASAANAHDRAEIPMFG